MSYVDCLESLVRVDTFDSDTDCWKLTALCRDIFATPDMDEFGNGDIPSAFRAKQKNTST